MRRPEQDIRLGIRSLLRQLGFAVYDMAQHRPFRQDIGFLDLVVIGSGRILFVKVKSPQNRLTPFQAAFARTIRENGGTFLVWRSIQDAWEWLSTAGIVAEAPGRPLSAAGADRLP